MREHCRHLKIFNHISLIFYVKNTVYNNYTDSNKKNFLILKFIRYLRIYKTTKYKHNDY